MTIAEIPEAVRGRVETLRDNVTKLRQPYSELRMVFNPEQARTVQVERQVMPVVQLSVRMPEKDTVQFIVQRIKPPEVPVVLLEVSGEEYRALQHVAESAQVSWELLFEQICNGA